MGRYRAITIRRADRRPSRETNVFVADWIETPEAADSAFQTVDVTE